MKIAAGNFSPLLFLRGKTALPLIFASILSFSLLFLLYWPARNMGFYFDDQITVLLNEKIHSPSPLTAMSENPFRAMVNLTFWAQVQLHTPSLPQWAQRLKDASSHITIKFDKTYQRDFAFLSLPQTGALIPVSIDANRGLVFPRPPARPFRLFNLVLHFLNGLLLLSLLRRLFPLRPLTAAPPLAVLLSPLAVEPVNYITARFGLMAITFSLAAVRAHLAADSRPSRDIYTLILFLLALLCKETAVLLPLLLFFLDLGRGQPSLRPLAGLLVSVFYLLLRLRWQIELGPEGRLILPWFSYLLVQQRVLWIYLLKIFWPIHLNFEPSITPFLPLDLFCALLNASLLYISAYTLLPPLRHWLAVRSLSLASPSLSPLSSPSPSPRSPTLALTKGLPPQPSAFRLWAALVLLMSWLLLAPTSSIIPLHDLIREERAYPLLFVVLPALLLAWPSGKGVLPLQKPSALPSGGAGHRLFFSLRRGAIVFFLVCSALLSWHRNHAWSSELSLARDAVRKSPHERRAVYNYATALKWSRRYDTAVVWFERVLEIDPGNADAWTNIEALRRKNQP